MLLVSSERGGRRVPTQWWNTRPELGSGVALVRKIPYDSSGRYAARRMATHLSVELALNLACSSRPLNIRDEALDGLSTSLQETFNFPSSEAEQV